MLEEYYTIESITRPRDQAFPKIKKYHAKGWKPVANSLDEIFNYIDHTSMLEVQRLGYYIHVYQAPRARLVVSHRAIDMNRAILIGTIKILDPTITITHEKHNRNRCARVLQ